MKYMTKKWFETMQKTDLSLLLKEDERASLFSEDYYEEIYQSEFQKKPNNFEKIYQNNRKRLQKKLPKEILKKIKDIRVLALGYATKEVIEAIEKMTKRIRTMLKKRYKNTMIFMINNLQPINHHF